MINFDIYDEKTMIIIQYCSVLSKCSYVGKYHLIFIILKKVS